MGLATGHTWVDGEQITSAKLNATVNSGTATNIVQTDLASGYSLVVIGDVAPSSPAEGWAWFDTSPGAGEGVLRYYNGAHWIPVGRGFLGYNTSGSTIDAGMLVADNAQASGTADFRQEIKAVTLHLVPLGMALTQITNGSTGVIIRDGRVLALLQTGTVVAGEPVVPSSTTGKATTGVDANFGSIYGSGVCGIWTKSGSGASNEALLFPAARASGVSFRTPTRLVNATLLAGSDNVWSGSYGVPIHCTWSSTPPGVIARLVAIRYREVTASATKQAVVAIRQKSSAETVANGCAQIAGAFKSDGGASADNIWLAGRTWVMTNPAGDGTDRAEFLVKTDGTITDGRLEIWEVAVMCGGRVV